MTIQERYLGLVQELLDGIDQGDFTNIESIPDKYSYQHLEALLFYAEQLDGGCELFRHLYDIVMLSGIRKVRDKYAERGKINLTFLTISAAEWPANNLYELLSKDTRFNVTVTICPLIDRSIDERKRTYLQNRDFFEGKGYRVINAYNADDDRISSWEELGEVPDIIIHVSMWHESLPQCYRISSFKFDCMNLYIPYGLIAGNSMNGQFVTQVCYNKDFLNLMHRVYASTKMDYDNYKKYQLLQGKNVIYSGYAKMDFFYGNREFEEDEIRKIWKIPINKRAEEMKKIIIAPHHSFLGYCGIVFSTFAQNVHFWLYLAEKYKETISFVFKPHPNLRYRAVEAKIFASSDEYDAYIARWNSLPNAMVVEESSYLELFATSDAIIMDSMSFIAEYMYADKPVLYLRRPEQAFYELGRRCLSAYHQVSGFDYVGIEKFINNTVLDGDDCYKTLREEIFSESFDYYKDNNSLASEIIYNDIVDIIFENKE